MRADATRDRRAAPARRGAAADARPPSACVPMDNVMQAVFGRSMREPARRSIRTRTPRMPPGGSVSFASGNYPAHAGQVNLGQAEGLAVDVPPFTAGRHGCDRARRALANPVPPTARRSQRGTGDFERTARRLPRAAPAIRTEAPDPAEACRR